MNDFKPTPTSIQIQIFTDISIISTASNTLENQPLRVGFELYKDVGRGACSNRFVRQNIKEF